MKSPQASSPIRFLAILVLALVLRTASAGAQGFGVYEQGSCAMGRAGAGVAAPCDDGSAVYFNPAGIANERGFTVSGGLTGIAAFGSFRSETGVETELDNPLVLVPHGYFVAAPRGRLALGMGLYVPYGLTTRWPPSFEGAFVGYDNSLSSTYLQPTLAYRLDDHVSVGGGVVVAIGRVELNQTLDLSTQPVPSPGVPPGTTFGRLGVPRGTAFATARLKATGATGVGANFGILAKVNERLAFGARYLTRVTLDYRGTARFRSASTGIVLGPGNAFGASAGTPLDAILQAAGTFGPNGPLSDQDVSTTVTMPDQLVVGARVGLSDRFALLADYQWTHWSVFDTLRIDFASPRTPAEVLVEDFRNTGGLRLGAELALHGGFTLRGGYIFNQSAEPPQAVTPLLPEGRRHQFTAGFSYRRSAVELSAAYQFLQQEDRAGRVMNPPSGEAPTVALNSGLYAFHGQLFGGTFTLRF